MKNRARAVMLIACLVLSGCAPFNPYRTAMPEESVPTGFACEVDGEPAGRLHTGAQAGLAPCETAKSEDAGPSPALMHRHYTGSFKPEKGKPDKPDKGNYFLSFVEFDDQGWFADRRQMDALFALLNDLKDKKRETLIYVYAHGWKHNASACDDNVVCFSRLLERLDLTEKKIRNDDKDEQRTVVGVYLGWRGLPFGGVLNNLSFWSRKDTAARVGRGGVFELLTRLNDYRVNRQIGKEAESLKTQLIITGHSFGGLVVYSALSHALMERAARTTTDDKGTRYEEAQSFGDFVMLMNPAFEGSLYEPLFHIATNRCYERTQRPVMMIVTSEADSATRLAFPAGRDLGTLLQHARSPAQRTSMRKTIGHDARYITHNLTDLNEGKKFKVVDDSECGCPYLEPTATWSQKGLLQVLGGVTAVAGFGKNDYIGGLAENNSTAAASLDVTPDVKAEKPVELTSVTRQNAGSTYAANYPYLVVKTDEKLIPNHNAIYNERFTSFAQVFMLAHVLQPATQTSRRLPADDGKQQCLAIENNRAVPGSAGLLPRERSCMDDNMNPCASITD